MVNIDGFYERFVTGPVRCSHEMPPITTVARKLRARTRAYISPYYLILAVYLHELQSVEDVNMYLGAEPLTFSS
jgi:hypothetical protein